MEANESETLLSFTAAIDAVDVLERETELVDVPITVEFIDRLRLLDEVDGSAEGLDSDAGNDEEAVALTEELDTRALELAVLE